MVHWEWSSLAESSESSREKYPEFADLEWICIIEIIFFGEFRRCVQIEAFILSLKMSINTVVIVLIMEHVLWLKM